MNHSKRNRPVRRPVLGALAVALTLAVGAPAAEAGRGGSFARIRSAAQKGSVDAIVAELERAENIPCTSECMTFVLGLLDHDSYAVRDAAAWWFARRPAQMVEVTEQARARLASGSSAEVRSAADALARVGRPGVIPDLAAAIQRAGLSDEARAHAVRALGRIGHRSANAPLAAAMGDGSALVRREAVESWTRVLRQADAAPVVALVTDTDVSVRRAATQAVGRFPAAAARAALEGLVASDPDPAVRRNAAWALGHIGDAASREALAAAASDPSSLVRMTARAALRQLR